MFTGVSLDQALKYWKNGKEVIVLDRTVKSPAGEEYRDYFKTGI